MRLFENEVMTYDNEDDYILERKAYFDTLSYDELQSLIDNTPLYDPNFYGEIVHKLMQNALDYKTNYK